MALVVARIELRGHDWRWEPARDVALCASCAELLTTAPRWCATYAGMRRPSPVALEA